MQLRPPCAGSSHGASGLDLTLTLTLTQLPWGITHQRFYRFLTALKHSNFTGFKELSILDNSKIDKSKPQPQPQPPMRPWLQVG